MKIIGPLFVDLDKHDGYGGTWYSTLRTVLRFGAFRFGITFGFGRIREKGQQ